jgi:hypothetical protein
MRPTALSCGGRADTTSRRNARGASPPLSSASSASTCVVRRGGSLRRSWRDLAIRNDCAVQTSESKLVKPVGQLGEFHLAYGHLARRLVSGRQDPRDISTGQLGLKRWSRGGAPCLKSKPAEGSAFGGEGPCRGVPLRAGRGQLRHRGPSQDRMPPCHCLQRWASTVLIASSPSRSLRSASRSSSSSGSCTRVRAQGVQRTGLCFSN